MKKKLLIAGGSGLIGTAISEKALQEGWEVTLLSRSAGPGRILWNPREGIIQLEESKSFDAIINLAGSSIAGGRWTNKRKKDIVDSRVQACHTLQKYLETGLLKTRVYLGASAIGIYGDKKNEPVDESTPVGSPNDWMSNTVQEWEKGHSSIEALGIHTVVLRIGIVLSMNGGALPEMLRTASFGILGYFGNGLQVWPWIHIDDLVGIFLQAADDEKMRGVYFAGAPGPVTNKVMTIAAAKAYTPHRLVIPVPALMLSVLLGEMRQMLLQSCNGQPTRLLKEGFKFRYNTIDAAMQDLIRKR